MDAIKIKAMQDHCDELTKDGNELSVKWEGGNDSGWFELSVNGKEIDNPSPLVQDIIEFVENHIGYGSFAGDFFTDGELSYNRADKCFVGADTYSETDQRIQECEIAFSIPETVWFDHLTLSVSSERSNDTIEASIFLQILNGPHPEDFDTTKSQLEIHINQQFSDLIDHIEDFAGIWEEYLFPRKDFQARDGMLHYSINKFNFSYHETDVKEIYISFLD